jgi:putative PEP-CTERM system histidine kinase
VLFNQLDPDAFGIRGAVHALVVPFLVLSTARRSDWLSKIQISRRVAFHSATLMIAGLYLLFISGVGYYVRYFGGDWGGALQLGLVFLGLVGMVVLVLSGSLRARLRVFLGKNFFRYRYDYREEWLRFTQTLSAKSSPQEVGAQVIRGLADMLECPGGALWMKSRGDAGFTQTARWNLAECAEIEDANFAIEPFLKPSGWVINLEEFRPTPAAMASWCCRSGCTHCRRPGWSCRCSGRRDDRLRGAGEGARPDGRQLGGATCSRRPAARRPASWPRCRPPRRCWRRASSTPSTACRPSSCTT